MATDFGRSTDPGKALDAAHQVTHFGSGGRKRSSGLFKHLTSELTERNQNNSFFTENDLKKAQLHLGTQGDGNHFLFVGRSEQHGGVTLVTHHGSRGFGAGLYKSAMKVAETFRQQLCPEVTAESAWIPFQSEEGRAYWEALQIIRDWTKLNHELIHQLLHKKQG